MSVGGSVARAGRVVRSLLYVPGDSEPKLDAADSAGADALVYDLEDAVPPRAKATARALVSERLRGVPPAGGPDRWVRVNAGEALADDVEGVVAVGLTGIVVPKCDATVLRRVDELLGGAERRAGLAPGSIAVNGLVESARGVLDARAIAAGPRVARLQLGEADLCGELGIDPDRDPGEAERALLPIRMQVVLASAAGGLARPVAPVFRVVGDLEGLRTSTAALRAIGFGGRSVIHPRQVATVNEAFRPSAEELARARRVLDEFERRRGEGTGVYVDEDGRMVDEAVVRSARLLLAEDGR